MPSKREQALASLFLCLKSGISETKIVRNEVLTTAIPDSGLAILRDGDAGEPEIILSPPRYIYNHRAEIEIIVQEQDTQARDTKLDEIAVSISDSLSSAGTLNGNVDLLSTGAPEFITEAIEGAATIKAAIIPVYLEYVTSDPIG